MLVKATKKRRFERKLLQYWDNQQYCQCMRTKSCHKVDIVALMDLVFVEWMFEPPLPDKWSYFIAEDSFLEKRR